MRGIGGLGVKAGFMAGLWHVCHVYGTYRSSSFQDVRCPTAGFTNSTNYLFIQ